MKRFLCLNKIVCFIVTMFFSFCCYAKVPNEELQMKILWINHISEIVTKILTYNDKLVLTHEYEKLLENVNFDNLPAGEMKKLIGDLFSVLKTLSDNWEEKEHAKKMYEKACDDAFRNTLFTLGKGVLKTSTGIAKAGIELSAAVPTAGESFSVTNGKLLKAGIDEIQSGIPEAAFAIKGFFSIKEEANKIYGDKSRQLSIANYNKIHNLRIKIWNLVQEEIKNSNIPDSIRISLDDYKYFMAALKNASITEQYAIFSDPSQKHRFEKYPTFWYYLGRSSLAVKNFDEAKEAFDTFHKNYRSILRSTADEILHDCIIAEVSLLMHNIKKNEVQLYQKLDLLGKIVPTKEWHKRYFVANCYFVLGKYEIAKKILEANLATISMIHKENLHNKYVDLFGTKNIPLIYIPHNTSMEMQRALLAKIQIRDNTLDFDKFIQKYNHHKTLSIYEKMSYFGSISNERIVKELKKNLKNVSCEVSFSILGTELIVVLPTEWFCSSQMPEFVFQFDNANVKVNNIKLENENKKFITLKCSIDLDFNQARECKKMLFTIKHPYSVVKVIFEIPVIPKDVTYETSGKNKYTRFASKLWNKSKEITNTSIDKLKTRKYNLELKRFIFNGKQELLD